jgi:tetratricopeptide (TPR) repeat protein
VALGVSLVRIGLLAALALTLPAATFDELAATAKTAREAGRFDDAIAAYRQALAQKPDWREGQWFLAVSLYEAKQYAPAAEAFEAVTEVAPESGAGWILLGVCEFELERYRPAVDHLTKGRSLGARKELLSTGAYHLALLMNHFGESEAALQLLLPFGAEANESPSVIEAFGLAILRRKQLPRAIPPEDREKVNQAGRAAFLMAAKRSQEGRQEMERLLARYPEDLDIRDAYASMLIESEPEAAIEQFRKVLAGNPDDYHANRLLGTLLSKQRQFDEALRLLENARRLRPHSIPARYQIAVAKLATGRLDESRTILEEILAEADEFTAAHVTLATVYYRLGRKEEGDRQRAIVRDLNANNQAGKRGSSDGAGVSSEPGEKP